MQRTVLDALIVNRHVDRIKQRFRNVRTERGLGSLWEQFNENTVDHRRLEIVPISKDGLFDY